MKKLSGIFVGLLLAFASAGIANAGTQSVAANIFGTGTAAGPAYVDTTNGNACNLSSWVDQCPSGNCQCITLTSPRISKRKVTVSNVFFTIDSGINPATESAVNSGPTPGCNPIFGTADLVDNTGGSETLNFLGTSCRNVIKITRSNPQGVHNKDILSGGWGISSAPTPNPLVSGWGTLAGTVNSTTQAVKLHLRGKVSE